MSEAEIDAAMVKQYPPTPEQAEQRRLREGGAPYSAELGKYLTSEEAQARSRETTVSMNAAQNNREQSGTLQGLRTLFRHATFGWGPDITAGATSALTGEDAQLREDIERRQDDLNAQEHPVRNAVLSGLGTAAGVAGTAVRPQARSSRLPEHSSPASRLSPPRGASLRATPC
ncbi:hypothetical protein T281_14990 [Rhodomicrobium udaipurense JA643]|uniref:Uncharacterized protein n=1 Tax=Rhodomicrobium udaipurense TaxID=1202716 RepID=A0A8I1G874_9HYPH|nr:hypothetical protein [Rhodomicrobium udaipurense]KAI93726.1 hypothetical protein T281_14990 [Rhodomicrobium udaipurense JA643]MBJ7542343.1 hypothetical protein [Rhodomicrobium udaipurense]